MLSFAVGHQLKLGDTFIFQQDSAPAHRARDTVAFLSRLETPNFYWSTSLVPKQSRMVDYKVWVSCRKECIERQYAMWTFKR